MLPFATSAEVGVCTEDSQPLVYVTEASLRASVHRSSVKKRDHSSPMVRIER